jgi:CRP-like cAMP-binding protein
MWPRLASIDRSRRPVDVGLLGVARSNAVFSPLPPYAMEQVMHAMVPEHFDAGQVLMRQGDAGDRMCLLVDGDVEIEADGDTGPGSGTVSRHGPGVVLGEIALLRDIPRTATVTAATADVRVYWMDADSFLDAVNRIPRSRARAEAEANRRLER